MSYSTDLLVTDDLNIDVFTLSGHIVITATEFEDGYFQDEVSVRVNLDKVQEMYNILGEFIKLYKENNNV